MNRNKHPLISAVIVSACALLLLACTASESGVSATTASANTTDKPQIKDKTAAVRLPVKNNDLKKIYTQAITEFIAIVYRRDQTIFDTLYFGKRAFGQPDDFPDIELPESIDKTQLRLVSPEVGQQLQTERKSLVYINLMGWVDVAQANFIFVVFTNGFEHQYDYYIDFVFSPSSHNFELDQIAFEDYLHLNGEKPNRLIIYKDDKYMKKW